jgi:hypothetical protein
MAGENLILSWGRNTWRLKCTRILYGPNIISTQDSGQGGIHYGGYAAKAIYVRQYFMSTVGVTVIHSTWEDREAFVNWCISYGKYISSQTGIPIPMRIQGPRKFDYYGVLTEGFGRSNAVTDLAYTMNLTFRGSQPTVGGKPIFGGGSAVPNPPASLGGANSKFYPFEILPAGPPTAEAALYNAPLNDSGGFSATLPPNVNNPSSQNNSVLNTSIPGHPGKGAVND